MLGDIIDYDTFKTGTDKASSYYALYGVLLKTISGVVPSLLNLPAGCLYSDRCPDVFDDCRQVEPEMVQVADHHYVRCLKYA